MTPQRPVSDATRPQANRPRYKTWIRTRPLILLAVAFATCLGLGMLGVVHTLLLACLVPAGALGYALLIVGLSRYRLSPAGGDYQSRVHELVVTRVRGDRILDIGCGSGHLLARIAHAQPAASLTGIDYWGSEWEYSQDLCVTNLRAEGLDGRVTFVRASAANLPPDLSRFDCVVSCLTFHEVNDVTNKTSCLREALLQLKPGGCFVFIDLFSDARHYPLPSAIEAAITETRGVTTERVRLADLMPLPFPLKHRRVLGTAELIAGYTSERE